MRFNADVLGQFLRKIYDGFDTANEIEPTMWREILRVINEGTVEGLSQAAVPPTHDRLFYQSLRHSNEVFAAFKTHTMGREMAAKLLDASGNLKSFDKWVRDVSSISRHQVGSWLRTEYDTAVIRAHAAADWREFERNKDIMPNLRWMPTTSPDPETSHAAYWKMKLTLPVDHPFWDEHHPGDRWNCKCSLEATDAPATPVPDGSAVGLPQRGLENNPGKDGHTFSDNHPYFPSDCNHCAFNKGFKNRLRVVFNNEDKHCNNCGNIDAKLPTSQKEERRRIEKNRQLYERLSRDSRYYDVKFNPETGAVKAIHRGHKVDVSGKDRGKQMENILIDKLFDAGHTVILCDESKRRPHTFNERGKRVQGCEYRALDMILDGVMMDIYSPDNNKKFYGWGIYGKNNQLIDYNSRPDVHTPADTVCIYFDNPSWFSPKKIEKGFAFATEEAEKRKEKIIVKHIVCAINSAKGLELKTFDF